MKFLATRGKIRKLAGPATMTSRAYKREGERVKKGDLPL